MSCDTQPKTTARLKQPSRGEQIEAAIQSMPSDEQEIVRLRYGLGGREVHQVTAIANRLEMSLHEVHYALKRATAKLDSRCRFNVRVELRRMAGMDERGRVIYEPTREEIEAKAALIREGWDEKRFDEARACVTTRTVKAHYRLAPDIEL